MHTKTTQDLQSSRCLPCAHDRAPFAPVEAEAQLRALSDWHLSEDGRRIHKRWTCKDFAAAIEFLNSVARLAEDEGHHPDFHLEDYRRVQIELWTHAIGGLSVNDFVLAAKIDALPVREKEAKQG